MRRILLLLIILSNPAYAGDLVTQTARDHIDVTVGFVGSSIEIFGDRRDPSADIAIVVEGPKVNVTLWQKAQVLGAWVNTSNAKFESLPAYYNFATSMPMDDERTSEILRKNGIGHAALFDRTPTKTKKAKNVKNFRQALKDKKIKQNVFFKDPAPVKFLNEHFFRARFEIPPSAPTGEYKIHSYLIKNGKITQHDVSVFKVEQVGINAFIFDAAQKYSTLYALVCITLALFAGWLVSALRVKP